MTKRRAVITGVNGGIGAACAQLFLEEGWDVVGLDVSGANRNPDFTFIQCDVADVNSVIGACAEIRDSGPIHTLVNNAAMQLNAPLTKTTANEWDLVMNTNVRGAFLCMRELIPSLSEVAGSVVNVASVHAVATSGNIGAYAASKGALVALTRAAAVELAEYGIRCNALLPGAVDTPMLRDGLSRRPHPDGPEGNLAELVARTPLRSVATPSQIATSVLFLADGDRSAFTTGQALVVDGGATARLSTE